MANRESGAGADPNNLVDLAGEERHLLAAMWAYRARSEGEAAAHYEDLARRLQRDGGPLARFGERIEAARRDELRHQEICAAMAARFGHIARGPESPKTRRIAPHDLHGPARLAYEVVACFCVTESINATLLLRSGEQARDDETRRVLRALLVDEVDHSRIGWAYLASDSEWRCEIAERLPVILKATTHDDDFLVSSPRPSSAALVAYGLLSRDGLRSVFREAMEGVVLPGLEHCSVDTGEARRWLQALVGRWQS